METTVAEMLESAFNLTQKLALKDSLTTKNPEKLHTPADKTHRKTEKWIYYKLRETIGDVDGILALKMPRMVFVKHFDFLKSYSGETSAALVPQLVDDQVHLYAVVGLSEEQIESIHEFSVMLVSMYRAYDFTNPPQGVR